MISNARDAIKLAKDVILEAGYLTSKIIDVEYDEDDESWVVQALSGETEIELKIDKKGGVHDFTTG